MSTSTPNSCWPCTAAAGRLMRWPCTTACGERLMRSWESTQARCYATWKRPYSGRMLNSTHPRRPPHPTSARRRPGRRSLRQGLLRQRCRFRRSCWRQCPPSPGATPRRPASTLSCPRWPRPACPRPPLSSWRSRAPPEWARPPWPCTGRTRSQTASRTGSCISTCAVSIRAGRRWSRARQCADSWMHSGSRWRGSPRACQPRRPSIAAFSPVSGYWSYSTTREMPRRFARCCPARPGAWPS